MRARSFNHFGPGQKENFVAAALTKRMLLAQHLGQSEITVGNLETIRDFTDVRDVVRAYRLIVTKGEGGSVYNVCSGIGRKISELASTLLSKIDTELELKVDPKLHRPSDTESQGTAYKIYACGIMTAGKTSDKVEILIPLESLIVMPN